jgi:hypothetical protein
MYSLIPTVSPGDTDGTNSPSEGTSSPTWPTPLISRTSSPTHTQTIYTDTLPTLDNSPESSPSSHQGNSPTYTGTLPSPSQVSSETDSPNDFPPTDNAETLDCKSDETGQFGFTNGSQATEKLVQYQYQVETRSKFQITDADMNAEVLSRVEKAISDLVVATFFSVQDGYVCVNATLPIDETSSRRSLLRQQYQRLLQSNAAIPANDQQDVAAASSSTVVGLSANPPDYVLDSDSGGMLC